MARKKRKSLDEIYEEADREALNLNVYDRRFIKRSRTLCHSSANHSGIYF